jgi:hypothetical protein
MDVHILSSFLFITGVRCQQWSMMVSLSFRELRTECKEDRNPLDQCETELQLSPSISLWGQWLDTNTHKTVHVSLYYPRFVIYQCFVQIATSDHDQRGTCCDKTIYFYFQTHFKHVVLSSDTRWCMYIPVAIPSMYVHYLLLIYLLWDAENC